MGRHYGSGKDKVDEYKNISTTFLSKHNYFQGFQTGVMTRSRNGEITGKIGIEVSTWKDEPYCRVHFTQTDRRTQEVKEHDYKIRLSKTVCNYGGCRYWFICPCSGRRCTKLYLQRNGMFCDRVAMDLVYDSQYTNKNFRGLDKIIGSWKAEELYASIKFKYWRGKMTKKYKKYLEMTSYSHAEYDKAMNYLTKGRK